MPDDQNLNSGRRDLIKRLLLGILATGLGTLPCRFNPTANAAAAALKLIDEQKDISAKALGYRHDGSKTQRKDPKEHCGTCKQYEKFGVINGEEVGKCSLLAKGLVKEEGWCRSYLKDEVLYKQSH